MDLPPDSIGDPVVLPPKRPSLLERIAQSLAEIGVTLKRLEASHWKTIAVSAFACLGAGWSASTLIYTYRYMSKGEVALNYVPRATVADLYVSAELLNRDYVSRGAHNAELQQLRDTINDPQRKTALDDYRKRIVELEVLLDRQQNFAIEAASTRQSLAVATAEIESLKTENESLLAKLVSLTSEHDKLIKETSPQVQIERVKTALRDALAREADFFAEREIIEGELSGLSVRINAEKSPTEKANLMANSNALLGKLRAIDPQRYAVQQIISSLREELDKLKGTAKKDSTINP